MKSKTIDLGVHGIVVELFSNGTGSITSDLKKSDVESEMDMMEDEKEFLAAVDGVESLILAHAMAGVKVNSKAYITGLEVTIETITNQFL